MEEEKVISSGYFQFIFEKLSTFEKEVTWLNNDPLSAYEEELRRLIYEPLSTFEPEEEAQTLINYEEVRLADEVLAKLGQLKMEVRFLIELCFCLETWVCVHQVIRAAFSSIITSLQHIWEKEEVNELMLLCLTALRERDLTYWHLLVSQLDGKIQLSKVEVKAKLVNFLDWSFKVKPLPNYMIIQVLDSILFNLDYLVRIKDAEYVLFKKQIETLKEKLVFLKSILQLSLNCIDGKELDEFNMFAMLFVIDAMFLTFLYWAKGNDDEFAFETNSMISHMSQKIKPATPDVARLYFQTLKAIYVQRSDSLMFGQTTLSFAYLFLDDLMTHSNDDLQILRDNIVFLLTFLNDPPDDNAEVINCSQIDDLFWEDVYGFLPFDDMEGDTSKKKLILSDFMMKIESVNANIRRIFGRFPHSSSYNFPKVISPGFLEFLIHNLRNLKDRITSDPKQVPFAKCKIIKMEEELAALCPFFDHFFNFQNELSETWSDFVNLLYLVEHVINSWVSSLFVFDLPIWYHMAFFSDTFDKIKDVKINLEKIKESTTKARCLPNFVEFIRTPSVDAIYSEINEIVIGFEDEADKITSNLTRGTLSFDTVSIVGMAGLGKTTLAKKVYATAKCNFNVFAFCSVTQNPNTRRMLLDILFDILGNRNKIMPDMTDDDLKQQLRKCLSRQKYLIVLDDIWDVSAWSKVKDSFPDNENGSRVMFTTRSREVANACKIICRPHQLRFLSEDECWELFQKKVFPNNVLPSYLFEIGKLIAKSCKRLPLAVVVIAGLLARTEKSLGWWSEVAKNVISYLIDEGCMKILELSYHHLPEHLKPCLIYLGAFPIDRLIRVKQMILMWIAEGFIQESKTKSIEDVAKDYFHDLVARSLIIVGARSSNGEIKTFLVHDLIHDLCQAKCREGNFCQLNYGIALSSSIDPLTNNDYRVSIQKQGDVIADVGSSLSNAHTLLFFCDQLINNNSNFPLRRFRLAQVLLLESIRVGYILHLSSLVHLRHIDITLLTLKEEPIPSSIFDLWNIRSIALTSINEKIDFVETSWSMYLPETIWKMKSLTHVKIERCILKFSDGHEHEEYPELDKVISFSKPILSTGEDVQRLLQRLPAIRELNCILLKSVADYEEAVELLDFHRELESLKLTQIIETFPAGCRFSHNSYYSINFPSTLKKLTLVHILLHLTPISTIAKLNCLQVLKLRWISFPEKRLEMEDLIFPNLKFIELYKADLVEWNASVESLPCLEQLVIIRTTLEELPPCFEEISTLKRIVIKNSPVVESSALRLQEELMELGMKVEVSIFKRDDEFRKWF